MVTSLPLPSDPSADDASSEDRKPDDRRAIVVFIEKLPDLLQAAAPIIVALIINPPPFWQ